MLFTYFDFLEFFEDTIAEEKYEAQKLDIMRDALRSKATYTIESKKMEKDEKNESSLSTLMESNKTDSV